MVCSSVTASAVSRRAACVLVENVAGRGSEHDFPTKFDIFALDPTTPVQTYGSNLALGWPQMDHMLSTYASLSLRAGA